MDILIYLIFLLGSYSPGYGLVRVGFPQAQKFKLIQKIAFGYVAGIILFGAPYLITLLFNLNDIYYLLVCLIVYFVLFLLLFLKRTILKQTDELTNEDIIELNKLNPNKNTVPQPINYANLVKDMADEETLTLNKQTNMNKITFDQGLMVKSRKTENASFKGENVNIINKVSAQNNNIEKNQGEDQKNSMLAKLREYAQEINNQKKKTLKNEDEEALESEEELNNIFKEE